MSSPDVFPARSRSRSAAMIAWIAAITGIGMALSLGTVPVHAAVTDPPTIVSLTFDDGNADQSAGVSILDAAGMKGTFFITTGWIDAASYFTRAQLTALKASGHEIAGHTVSHPDLALSPIDEATKQICQGRNTLSDWGFPTTDFAYPFASLNPAVEAAVQACGFNSARSLGDIATRFGGTDVAETTPPADPFQTRAADEVDSTWTLADLQGIVTNAEAAGGGWVQYTFHHVCATACDPLNLTITPTLLQQFVTWLAARAPTAAGSTTNTVVETVQQVVGGAVKPLVASTNAFRPAPAAGVNGVLNPSLETAGAVGQPPQCWQEAGFGISTRTFSTVTAAHTGTAAEQLVVTGLTSGDAKLALTQDLGTCAPTATPGHTYSLRAWYNSTVTTQFDVYYRNAVGGWIYWTSSPFFAASTVYTQAVWATPAVPAGSTGISFGLNLISNGTLVTDDYALYDAVGAPPILGAIGPHDFNGDGHSDVLSRDASGLLWLYPGSGTGGWLTPRLVGSGWNGMTAILSPGDFNGDGHPDVLARDGAGLLWLYPGSGTGGWFAPKLVGSGWNGMTAILSPGDFNGDGHPDVLARDALGRLWLYPGSGTGGWFAPKLVGSGWNGMTAIL